MVAFESETRAYFSPPADYFWRWQDAGQVICWVDGRTIAFRDELLAIIERLAADGLPPLGSVLLVLAACRDNWHEPPNRRGLLAALLKEPGESVPAADSELLSEVCSQLDRMHQSLTHEQRKAPKAKAELCDLLFNASASRSAAFQATNVIAGLQLGLTPEHIEPQLATRPARLVRRDLQCLLKGLNRFNPQTLQLRATTGLEQQVVPAPIEVPPGGTARMLIAQLQDDPQLCGLGRLARRLLSVVQWPRPLEEMYDLPCGGVSDIANRGPLDRLLISELAYDDLTLATRVANGEALYLRREVPPSIPPRQRRVLIDSGIRLWGVPRIFATAVGLALAAASHSDFDVELYRASGPELEPIDLSSQAGLVAHLGALDYRAHPGEALQKWQSLCAISADATDTVIVTGDDVLEDPQFQRALEHLALDEWYIASVNREGQFRLLRRTRAGSKLLRQAQLSLDDVLAPQPAAAPLVAPRDGGMLPAFLLQQPLPLLLSRSLDVDRAWHLYGSGTLSLTNDRRLLLWNRPDRGARELAAGLPPGTLHCCTVDDRFNSNAVIGRLGQKRLFSLSVHLDTPQVAWVALQLDADTPRGAFFHAGFVFVVFDDHISAHDLVTGEHLSSERFLRKSWRGGRYFKVIGPNFETWWAASFDGRSIKFDKVPLHQAKVDDVAMIFDVVHVDGPVIVTRSADIIFPDGSWKAIEKPRSKPITFVAVARDGERFIIEQPRLPAGSTPSRLLVNVFTGSTTNIGFADPASAVDAPLNRVARPEILRYRFRGIAVDSRGRLTLISRHERRWPLEYRPDDFHFAKQGKPNNPPCRYLPFEPFAASSGDEYENLSVAKWPNGDRAILDSRGLLHLQTSDHRVPEFTIVLHEGQTAGWCADGRRWGSAYFCGDKAVTSASRIVLDVITPFIEGLR